MISESVQIFFTTETGLMRPIKHTLKVVFVWESELLTWYVYLVLLYKIMICKLYVYFQFNLFCVTLKTKYLKKFLYLRLLYYILYMCAISLTV